MNTLQDILQNQAVWGFQDMDIYHLCLEEGAWFAPYNIAVARRLHDGPHHFNKVFLLRSIWLIKWLLAKPACPCWKALAETRGSTHTPPHPALISVGY